MVLTLKSAEYKTTFPPIIQEYATYLFTIKGNSEKTICEYLLDLRTFFRYMIASETYEDIEQSDFEKISIKKIDLNFIKKITTADLMQFIAFAGTDRNNSTTTRMRKLSALRSFFRFLYVKKHYIDFNPAADIDSPKKKSTLPKYLTVQESVQLLEAVRKDTESKTTVRDYAIIVLFLNTGMRLSELVGLNLQSFDSELTTVKVLGKGNKERLIYLNDAARIAVAEYLRVRLDPKHIKTSSRALFLSKRQERISPKTVQWMVYKYIDMAGLGLKGISVHKLRHTAATLMYQTGKVDIRVLKDILGHEQLNTTQIYTHVVNRNMEEAMQNNPLSDLKISRPKITEYKEED